MAERFHDVSDYCPVTGCWARPGQPCLNLASGRPMYERDGRPVVHPGRVDPSWRRLRGPGVEHHPGDGGE